MAADPALNDGQHLHRDCDRHPEPTTLSLTDQLHSIHIRPIRPDDWHRLHVFHRRLSAHTVELRFHGAKLELSEPLAHRFTDLDGSNNVALVATTGMRGRILGVARYSRVTPTCAGVTFVVEDSYQHLRVGSRLMKRLRQTALDNEMTEFVAEVLPGNLSMLRLLREAGLTTSRYDQGDVEVYVGLTKPA